MIAKQKISAIAKAINIPGTDDWYICYHRRPIPNKAAAHRVTCLEHLYFEENGDVKPIVMTE